MEMLMSKMAYSRSRLEQTKAAKTSGDHTGRSPAKMTLKDIPFERDSAGAIGGDILRPRTGELDTAILECVDRGIGTLGDAAKRAAYWHMEFTFGLRREDIPRRPQAFVRSIRQMLGGGAQVLEKSIVKEMERAFMISAGFRSFDIIIEEIAQWSAVAPPSSSPPESLGM
jgi:hypothetical protein